MGVQVVIAILHDTVPALLNMIADLWCAVA